MLGSNQHISPATLKGLRRELVMVEDAKIRRITTLVEASGDPAVNQALLDPVRTRLRQIQPPRPLRLTRLLFMPFNPIIVPAKSWRSDSPAVPRTALLPIDRLVETMLGEDAAAIRAQLTGRDTEDVQAVADVGAVLWRKAAEIAGQAEGVPRWSESGLPVSVSLPILRAMAVVWRRALQLRTLLRDEEIGALKTDERAVNAILADAPKESSLGAAMLIHLVLLQLPSAARYVRLFVRTYGDSSALALLQRALKRSIDDTVADLERADAFKDPVTNAALDHAGDHVRTLTTLLAQIEADIGDSSMPPRLKLIRDSLGKACRARFSMGMTQELIAPLDAANPIADGQQAQIEATARDLRTIEAAARPLGGGRDYDGMLEAGARAVAAAAQRGALSRIGQIRLTEILCGPEAALTLYRS